MSVVVDGGGECPVREGWKLPPRENELPRRKGPAGTACPHPCPLDRPTPPGPSPVAEFTTTNGAGSETVRVVAEDEHCTVNWRTDEFDLDPDFTYRIVVSVLSGGASGTTPDLKLGTSGTFEYGVIEGLGYNSVLARSP